jgi:hypothetical protein
MRLLVAFLFVTTSVLAQPIATIEKLGGYAIAPVRDGFVFAWSDEQHLYVTRLGAAFRPVSSSAKAIGLFSAGATPIPAAIAVDGSSVLVVWQERFGGLTTNVYAILSQDLATVETPARLIDFSATAPVAGFDGTAYIIATDFLYRVHRDGSSALIQPLPNHAIAALNAAGELATGESATNVTCTGAGPGWFTQCTRKDSIRIATGAFTKQLASSYPVYDEPVQQALTLGPHGRAFVALWRTREATYPRPVFVTHVLAFTNSQELASWQLDDVGSDFAIAGNGNDVLVVCGSGTLSFRVLHSDGTMTNAIMLAKGSKPKVIAVDAETFLVTYEVREPNATSVAGKLVRFSPPRTRAVR